MRRIASWIIRCSYVRQKSMATPLRRLTAFFDRVDLWAKGSIARAAQDDHPDVSIPACPMQGVRQLPIGGHTIAFNASGRLTVIVATPSFSSQRISV
jgi:hypothetical protein